MKKTFLLAIALLCFCAPMSLFAQKQLAFKDGKFKIVQFTDIHWDQKSSKCAKTVATIQSVLKAENPDVAMLSRPCWAAALESGAGMAWNLVLLFFCTAFLAGQSYNPFLYFRF